MDSFYRIDGNIYNPVKAKNTIFWLRSIVNGDVSSEERDFILRILYATENEYYEITGQEA